MTTAVGVGVIGMGFMGRQHTIAYRRVREHFFGQCDLEPSFKVVSDEVTELARKSAEQFGFERHTTDWREVVKDPSVQILSITTPNHLHKDIALATIKEGKPFWIEKPVGRFPSETEEIAAAARVAGLISTVGLIYREVPLVRHIRKIVQSGGLGEIQQYRGSFLVDYAANPKVALSWRFLQDQAGMGSLGDIMSHVADMAEFIVGPIAEVSAATETFIEQRPLVRGPISHFAVTQSADLGRVENEDYVGALVRFAGGAIGTLEVNRVIVGPALEMAFEVFGSEGSIRWNVERFNEFELYRPITSGDTGYTRVFASPEHEPFGQFQPGHAIGMGFDDLKTYQAFKFLKSVESGVQLDPSMDDMLATARVLDAMRRSAENKRWELVKRE